MKRNRAATTQYAERRTRIADRGGSGADDKKIILRTAFRLAFSVRAIALVTALLVALAPAFAAAGQDCDFDQTKREKNNLRLQRLYPGSRYIKDEHRLSIPVEEGEISLNIGGCVHYGVMIELKTSRTAKYDNEEVFMARILELIKDYSQGHIEYEKVKKLVAERNWKNVNPEGNDYYLWNYDGFSTFEVYRKHESGFTIIGINYYI